MIACAMKFAKTIVTIVVVVWMTKVALAQSSANVLLVINQSSPASVEIGSYYAQKRRIPSENVLRIQTNLSETIERLDFERQIESPVATWIARNSAQDRILYIVLTKGIPLRVSGTVG